MPRLDVPANALASALAIALASALWVAAGPACAADASAGKQKSAVCSGCHGNNGIALIPDAPNLAGQSPIYLAAQLRAFRGGERKHEVMSVMAKPLSDADIDNLSAWYGSIAIEVKSQP